MNAMSRETTLRNYLSQVKDRYEFVLIDCMPSLSMVTLNALSAADSVIIPVQAQYLPAKGMTQLVQTISKVKKYINQDIKIDGMLLTLVDNRTNLAKSTVEALRENFGNQIKLYRTSIPIAVKAAETSSKGKSIYAYEPNSTVSKAYAEFTKDTALMMTTSEKDGSFSFAKVPYGKWIVREIEQPKGFVLDEKAYEVNISKAEQVVEIEIVNEYVHGNIRLTKVDAEYPDNKLTGATFEVYKDTNENGKIDDGDELIGNLEEIETGIYEMKELLYGKYIVRETKAPEGFLLDKGEYSVFIEKDETTYSVENKAGVGFINEAMRGTLKIVKTS